MTTSTAAIRIACLALGVIAVLWSVWGARPRPYNINGDLGLRGVVAIALGLGLVAAGLIGVPS